MGGENFSFSGSGKENQMNDNAKVFSLIEMREMMIDTSDYQMMEEVGEFTGTLEMKAQGHKKSIRIFLTLDDGRKIITPIFWWQTYLGFMRKAIDFGIERSYSISSFDRVMRSQGFIVNTNPRRKYWTICSVNSNKSVRMYRLGDEYTNEAILRRIRVHYQQYGYGDAPSRQSNGLQSAENR